MGRVDRERVDVRRHDPFLLAAGDRLEADEPIKQPGCEPGRRRDRFSSDGRVLLAWALAGHLANDETRATLRYSLSGHTTASCDIGDGELRPELEEQVAGVLPDFGADRAGAALAPPAQ